MREEIKKKNLVCVFGLGEGEGRRLTLGHIHQYSETTLALYLEVTPFRAWETYELLRNQIWASWTQRMHSVHWDPSPANKQTNKIPMNQIYYWEVQSLPYMWCIPIQPPATKSVKKKLFLPCAKKKLFLPLLGELTRELRYVASCLLLKWALQLSSPWLYVSFYLNQG